MSIHRPFERRGGSPRRVTNGIKLRGTGDAIPRTWITQRWIALLEALIPAGPRREGLEYARSGQAMTLKVTPGRIEAEVQGRATRPYVTRWRLPVVSDEQWRRIIEAMAAEALYAAKLLSNELPPAVEALFASQQLPLLPPADEVVVECDCTIPGPCKHVAAVGYLLAERLDDDALYVFTLRGMPRDRVLEWLVQARVIPTPGAAAAHAHPVIPHAPYGPEPLEECLDAFWRPGSQLAQLQRMPPPQHAPHALLRRLGPSPLPGQFPLLGLLASIYDTVSRSAIRLRDQAERLEDSEVR